MGSDHNQLFFDASARHRNNMLFQLGHNNSNIFPGTSSSMISMEENPRIRPFFTSPDEIYDEEYYDEQLPEKKRRLTTEQVNQLEKSFEVENKLEPERKSELAKKLGLQPRQVAVWFQNRRARWKTKQLERDYDILKSSYDSLVANYEAILNDNQNLKSQVLSLTEKLESKGVNEKPIPDPGPEHAPKLAVPDPFAMVSSQLFSSKTEDRLSSGSGSGGGAVVDEDTNPQLVVDSFGGGGGCYFLDDEDHYRTCIGPFPSDEDDDVFASADQHQLDQQEGGETMGWWVW